MSRLDALQTLYDELPALDCKQLCADCCGVIPMMGLEFDRIVEHRRADSMRFGRDGEMVVMVGDPRHLTCPMLRNGRCSVYDVRPLTCRIWYCLEHTRCPHGCVPERYLTDAEAKGLYRRVEEIARMPEPHITVSGRVVGA